MSGGGLSTKWFVGGFGSIRWNASLAVHPAGISCVTNSKGPGFY